MSGTWYLPGGYNFICQRTGYKTKSNDLRKEWNGLVVRSGSWEPRHPQDMLRSFPDHQAVDEPNPEPPEDTFLGDNEVLASDL